MSNNYALDIGNCMGDLMYIVGADGVIRNANAMCRQILGVSREEVIGKTVDDLWNMGVFAKDYNFFIGYNETRAYELIESLFDKNLDEILVTEAPRLSYYAIEKKVTVSGITRLAKTGKVVLIVCMPSLKADGSVDYITAIVRDLTVIINLKSKVNIIENQIREQNRGLRDKSAFIGNSKSVKQIRYVIDAMSSSDASVLITGDTGTGKEVISKEIHKNSLRSEKPYICVNCAAIPENLFESELFGYEKGAFTGALNRTKVGIFEMAKGGTIFLDEIEALKLPMQAKLLRTLQEKTIRRVGGVEEIKIDVRIISASNRDLMEMIRAGEFREDLFYRLNVISIKIPPLRERKEDILPLTEAFLDRFNMKYEKNKLFSRSAMHRLEEHSWPGNIRELEHTVERLVVLGEGPVITESDVSHAIDDDFRGTTGQIDTLENVVNRAERTLLENAIREYGSSRKVAAALGVSQPTVLRKCRKLGINFSEE